MKIALNVYDRKTCTSELMEIDLLDYEPERTPYKVRSKDGKLIDATKLYKGTRVNGEKCMSILVVTDTTEQILEKIKEATPKPKARKLSEIMPEED